MEVAWKYLEDKLLLNINKEKSKICTPEECVFLGYQIVKSSRNSYGLDISKKNKRRIIRKIYFFINNISKYRCQWWDRVGAFHRGWLNYFKLAEADDLVKFVERAQRIEVWLMKKKIAEEREKGNEIPLESILKSKGFIFMKEWLPIVMSRRKQVKNE